jgi:hypothetical protein
LRLNVVFYICFTYYKKEGGNDKISNYSLINLEAKTSCRKNYPQGNDYYLNSTIVHANTILNRTGTSYKIVFFTYRLNATIEIYIVYKILFSIKINFL